MPGDYSRVRFDALKDHIGVLQQQGRVMLDADFNELVEIVERRFRAGDLDTFNRCVVPGVTPDGFRIQIAGSNLTIGPGRIYVDGILAENHGTGPLEFDQALEEERGTEPVPYDEQPYIPSATAVAPVPPDGGPHLVYLDVWQREITHVEDPGLVEKAVGVDTTARLQTVWQVRVLPDVGPNATCSSPDEDLEGWAEATAPSAGRLTTSAVGVPEDTDPCVVSPLGGFRGTENRLYRVEIHDPGPMGTATFKWSRDNGSVASIVTGINPAGDQLTVTRTARDERLRFSVDDWVEVLDDRLELSGAPGAMCRVSAVDDVAGTLTLDPPLAAADFDFANPRALHTRVRKWDQQGQVLDDGNAVVADVDASGGVIPIDGAAAFILENGVLVEFSLDPAGGEFHTGDYWVFAARTADATVEELDEAPPDGIHHHFCKLALVTFPESVTDCRTLWPPELGGGGCACAECVTAESHNSGAFTIQMALDRVAETGGRVCLGPGAYNLGSEPVRIAGSQSVKLTGVGLRTILFFAADQKASGPAVIVTGSTDVEVSSLAVASVSLNASPAILARDTALLRVERCGFLQFSVEGQGAGIALSGLVAETVIRENVVFADRAISAVASRASDLKAATVSQPAGGYVLTLDLSIEDNLLLGTRRGVSLDGLLLHLGDVRVASNTLVGSANGAVVTTGYVLPRAGRIDVDGNEIIVNGSGVVVGSDNVRVVDNDISSIASSATRDTVEGAGIVLVEGVVPTPVRRFEASGNRIVGIPGHGISIETAVESAMLHGNAIEEVGGGGILMAPTSAAETMSIRENRILDCYSGNDQALAVSAIQASRVDQLVIGENIVRGFALPAVQNPSVTGINVFASQSVRVHGNDLVDIGPPGGFVGQADGIRVVGPFDRLDVMDNSVRRLSQDDGSGDNSAWCALRITFPVVGAEFEGTIMLAESMNAEAMAADEATAASDTLPGADAISRHLDFLGEAVKSNAYIMDAVFEEAATGNLILVLVDTIVVMPRGRQIVGARGNLLEAKGNRPASRIAARGMCVFSENRCTLTPGPNTELPVVDIDAAGAIVSGNYLERPASDERPRSLDASVASGPLTLLGNVVTGRIVINGVDLPAASPWKPLNVEV